MTNAPPCAPFAQRSPETCVEFQSQSACAWKIRMIVNLNFSIQGGRSMFACHRLSYVACHRFEGFLRSIPKDRPKIARRFYAGEAGQTRLRPAEPAPERS